MLGQHLIKVRHFTRLRKISNDPRIKAVEENKVSVVGQQRHFAFVPATEVASLKGSCQISETRANSRHRTPSTARGRLLQSGMFGGHPRRRRNLFRRIVGINQIAGLLVSGRKYRLVAHASPSLEVRGIGNTVILYLQQA